jgi:predicted component of type VI protein secretion system
MPAQLLSLADGPSLTLDKPVMLIGRHEECDIQLKSRKVSRRHCCIAEVNDTLVVRDLGSTNGVRVNGKKLTEGRLKTGDELTIGNFTYRVQLEKIAKPPAVAAPIPIPSPGLDFDLELAEQPVVLEEVTPPQLLPNNDQTHRIPAPPKKRKSR